MTGQRNGRALVDYGRLLHLIGIEVEVMADSLDDSLVDALVPGCPGLTLGETARHVGSMYRMVWHWVRDGRRPGEWQRAPGTRQSLAGYLRSGVAPLLTELHSRNYDDRCSTWWPADETCGFWCRRMAHETTVHRVDVQGAAGIHIAEVAEDVAVDGIDEVLTLWFEHRLAVLDVRGTREYLVAVRAGGREWLARAGPDSVRIKRGWESLADESVADSAADAVVSGSPHDVYLWLWGRVPNQRVELDGDRDAIAQLWALLRLATR